MSALHIRAKCQYGGCECGGFQTIDFQAVPSTALTVCICEHAWWNHLMERTHRFSNNRWGNIQRACGGFYPRNDTEEWSAVSVCVCSSSWLSHSNVNAGADVGSGHPGQRPASSAAIESAFPSQSSRNSALPTSLLPPMFGGMSRATPRRGHSNTRRNDSMRRNRRTDFNRDQPSVVQTIGESSSTITEFLALLLPFQIPSECRESPSYRFNIEELAQLLLVLENHNLTCRLSLDGEEEVWRRVNEQISAKLSGAGILMAESSDVSPSQQGDRRHFKHTGLVANTFTLSKLANISRLVDNPCDNDSRLLLFFAPRYGHLNGPVHPGSAPHPCFPWRVWKTMQGVSPTRANQDALCITSCPNDGHMTGDSHSSPPSIQHQNPPGVLVVSSPGSSISTTESLESNIFGGPLQGPRSRASSNEISFQVIHPIISASYQTNIQWRDDVFATRTFDEDEGLNVIGPTPELIADSLIEMLKFHWACTNRPDTAGVFEPRNGVTCELYPLSAFISCFHRFELQTLTGRAGAVGNGPCRAVLRAGVKILIGSGIFTLRGDFYHPNLMSGDALGSPRRDLFWAAGFWCALHVLILGLLPDPITPWLLLACVYEEHGLPVDIEQTRNLDPTLADDLEPWFNFRAQDSLQSNDYMNPVRQLLINHLDVHDFSVYTAPRPQEFHDSTTRSLLSKILFGTVSFPGSHEFRAFKDGFNLDLGCTKLLDKLYMTNRPNFARQLFAGMSNRRVTSVQDILKRIAFVAKRTASSVLHDALRDMFQYRLQRWLRGRGHPIMLKGSHIPEDVFDREYDDPLLRARLLLRALTDMDLLPTDPDFTIKFALNVSIVTTTTPADASDPPALDIHTCEARANVNINEWLQGALQEHCTLHDNKCTMFDVWIHTQMILSGYNRF